MGTFTRNIAASPQVLTEFDEKLWAAAIDRVTMMLDDSYVFQSKMGRKLKDRTFVCIGPPNEVTKTVALRRYLPYT